MITWLTAAAAGHQASGGSRPGALGTWLQPALGQLGLPMGLGWSHCLTHAQLFASGGCRGAGGRFRLMLVPRNMFSTSTDKLLGWCR